MYVIVHEWLFKDKFSCILNHTTTHSLVVNTLRTFWPHPLATAPYDFQNRTWRHKSVHLQGIETSLSWIGHSACLVCDHYELYGTAEYLSRNSFSMSLLKNKKVLADLIWWIGKMFRSTLLLPNPGFHEDGYNSFPKQYCIFVYQTTRYHISKDSVLDTHRRMKLSSHSWMWGWPT